MVIEIDLFGNEEEDVIVVSNEQEEPQETENSKEIDCLDKYKDLQLQSIYDFPKKSLNIPIFYTSK